MKVELTKRQAERVVQRIGSITSCRFNWSDGRWWCWGHEVNDESRRSRKAGPPEKCWVQELQELFPRPYRDDGKW